MDDDEDQAAELCASLTELEAAELVEAIEAAGGLEAFMDGAAGAAWGAEPRSAFGWPHGRRKARWRQ